MMASRLRPLVLLAGGFACSGGAVALVPVLQALRPTALDHLADGLLLLAVCLVHLLLTRSALCCLSLVVAHVLLRPTAPGWWRRPSCRVAAVARAVALASCPRVLRSGVAAVLAAGLTAAAAGTAGAATSGPDPGGVSRHPATAQPQRPVGELPGTVWGQPALGPAPPPRRASPPGPERQVVIVRQGDCLWDLAARHLGDRTGHAAVDREWRRWWRANRSVIGSHPELLRPGLALQVPSAGTGES